MNTIQPGVPLTSPNASSRSHQIDAGPVQKFESIAPFDAKKLDILSPAQIQRLRDLQANSEQKTLIIHQGEIIATFGTNGWRHFQSNSDFDESYALMSDTQVISKLKEKYGSSLSVKTYPSGQGPSFAEVFEQVHGYKPSVINARV